MKQAILYLEQQSWRGGAQRVLEEVLAALEEEFAAMVTLPEDGPFASELRQRGIETLTYPLGLYRSGQKSITESIEFAARTMYCGFRLARTIVKRKIRLVYINGPRCLLTGIIAARLAGRPSLFHLHLNLTRKMDIFLAARAARHATRIVTCSKAAANALWTANPKLASITRVVYNPARNPVSGTPLTFESFTPTVPIPTSTRPVVGMVGRITPAKGQHLLLQAAAKLSGSLRDLQLIVVGAPAPGSRQDASYLRSLESAVRALGLENKVRWAGYQADPSPYYSMFDVLAIPSMGTDAFPLVALEAMQYGLPVVASRIGGIPELVRDGLNGLLFPPGDEKALAKCLERLLSDPALRARLGAGARASIDQRFSPETFRRAIRSIVFELCGPGKTLETERRSDEIAARI